MSILNYEEMTLESDTFQAARETFNLMMQDGESDGMMTVPDNVDEETDTDVPSGDYDSTDDSGMPLPFSEGDDDYPYDDPMEE